MNEFEKDQPSGESWVYGEPNAEPVTEPQSQAEQAPASPSGAEPSDGSGAEVTPRQEASAGGEAPNEPVKRENGPGAEGASGVSKPAGWGQAPSGYGPGSGGGYDSGPYTGNRPQQPPTYGPQGGYQNTPYAPPYYNHNWQNPPAGHQGGYPQGNRQGAYQQNQAAGQPGGRAYHQYGTSSGWQPPPPPPEKYEWKFADYEKLEAKKERKKHNRGLMVFTVALLCLLSVGIIALAGYSIHSAMIGEEQAPADEELETSYPDLPAGELEIAAKPNVGPAPTVDGRMTTPEVVKAVRQSVVAVIKYDNNYLVEAMGLGSGIIMSEDGYVITNTHVISQGTDFKVQLHNGDTYDAVLIGADDLSDVAVLKIDAENLSPAVFGDSNQLEVGETVVAIGNPGGLELAGSVTQGIVSALNREVRAANSMSYIQTDAAINPGISGGALVNEFAQVVGITSNKIVAEGYEGLGFAIPISDVKPIIDDLIANGRVTGRAMLGIRAQAVDPSTMSSVGERGVYIGEIYPESDLNRSGVLKGDIITHVEGERIYTLGDLRRVLDRKSPGDTVTLTIYRRIGTKEANFEVTTRLQEIDSDEESATK